MKNIFFIFIYLSVLSGSLFSEEWHVKKTDENLVKFTSSTSLLDFDGVTSNIDGYIYWEGEEIFGENNEIYFEVDLNTVETGIGKRDRDMREDVLETDKWPKTYYRGTILNYANHSNDPDKYIVESAGKMFIHGVENDQKVKAEIEIKNGLMNIVSDFSVFLKDFNIEAPTLLAFIKVAEEIKLHLYFQLEKVAEE